MATAAEILANIDAAIDARLSAGELVTEVSINGRTVRFETLDALNQTRARYEKLAAREARAAGSGTLYARFGRPS